MEKKIHIEKKIPIRMKKDGLPNKKLKDSLLNKVEDLVLIRSGVYSADK